MAETSVHGGSSFVPRHDAMVGLSGGPAVPDYFAKILKNKDRIIRVQAKRIEQLESEVERVRVARETLSTQLTLVSYKLELATAATLPVNSVISSQAEPNHQDALLETNRNLGDSCKNHAGAHYTALSSTPSSVANTATLPASKCSETPRAGDTKVKDGSGECRKMSDSELEELCSRYGGYMRAKRAATVIQQTYRQYSMSRSFAKLRLEAGESRRSQRFLRRRGLNGSHQDSIDVDRSLNLSQLCDAKVDDNLPEVQPAGNKDDKSSSALEDGPDKAPVGGLVPETTVVDLALDEFQGHNDLDDCDAHSGSSRSLSPTLPPPLPAPSDLPSVYFENSLDETVCRQHKVCLGHGVHDHMCTVCPASYSHDPRECPGSYFQHRPHHCYYDGVNFGVCPHQSKHRTGQRTPSHISTRHSDPSFRTSHSISAAFSSFARFGVLSDHAEPSPIWKRKSGSVESYDAGVGTSLEEWDMDMGRSVRADRPWSEVYPGSTTSSEDTGSIGSGDVTSQQLTQNHHHHTVDHVNHSVNSASSNRSSILSSSSASDRQRKRSYRIGLNLFNRDPDVGLRYLIRQRFVEHSASSIARFLITRKGLSKLKIGEYLGNLQQRFNMDVLGCFSEEVDLSGMQIDDALHKFQSYFRMPGEAQKIERLMEAFAGCYAECNADLVRQFRRADTVFLLAFAIVMLNTDLHNKNIKPDRKMKLDDFVRNLRGIDGGEDVKRDILVGIYDRTSRTPFKPAADHVTQVMKVEQMIVGKKPVLAEPHRRLVCYCRLFEVMDPNRRERTGQHQREVFLFNDMLMITKSASKKKDTVMYSFRQSIPIIGMIVYVFETPFYQFGIQLSDANSKILGTFCARNERDRSKFVDDLKEAILEVNEMALLETTFERNSIVSIRASSDGGSSVGACEHRGSSTIVAANRLSAPECGSDTTGICIHKSRTSSSLDDVNETTHRGSSASLDSGLPSTCSGSTGSCQHSGNTNAKPLPLLPLATNQLLPMSAPAPAGTKFNLFAKKTRGISGSDSVGGRLTSAPGAVEF